MPMMYGDKMKSGKTRKGPKVLGKGYDSMSYAIKKPMKSHMGPKGSHTKGQPKFKMMKVRTVM